VPDISGVAHLRLTVRDLHRSELWYREVFEFERVSKHNGAHFDTVVLRHPSSQLGISLCHHFGSGTARFDETRVGLDHLSFGVSGRNELEDWVKRLAELNVEHSPITNTEFGSVVVLRDPDHIQLELVCPRELD
jgi:glyoxylase I family protein